MAAVASRSTLVGALLRATNPVNRQTVYDYLQGLSCDELECIADFEAAQLIERMADNPCNSYRLMADFFEPAHSERWRNPDERAHKTFVVLAWLDYLNTSVPFRIPA